MTNEAFLFSSNSIADEILQLGIYFCDKDKQILQNLEFSLKLLRFFLKSFEIFGPSVDLKMSKNKPVLNVECITEVILT